MKIPWGYKMTGYLFICLNRMSLPFFFDPCLQVKSLHMMWHDSQLEVQVWVGHFTILLLVFIICLRGIHLPSLKLTAKELPKNWAGPQKERIIFQPSIFRGENVSFREANRWNMVELYSGISLLSWFYEKNSSLIFNEALESLAFEGRKLGGGSRNSSFWGWSFFFGGEHQWSLLIEATLLELSILDKNW